MTVVTLTLNPAIDMTVRCDHWQRGEVNLGQSLTLTAGGKGVNVASILADAGHAVSVTGLLGQDNSQVFEQLFAQKKIADHFIRVAGATRVGVKIVDQQADDTTDINLPGLQARPEHLEQILQYIQEKIHDPHTSTFILAGSLPPNTPPDFYLTLTRTLREAGKTVVADTSGEALRHLLTAEQPPHILKPNLQELSAALGQPLTTPQQVRAALTPLFTRGTELVAVSRGAEGAWLLTREESLSVSAPSVQVVSTVGAGDAMVAGLVSGRLRGLPLDEMARQAAAFGAGTVTRLGPHLPDSDTLRRLAEQITVQPLF